jgi:hypothetical protein
MSLCLYCGRVITKEQASKEHIFPKSIGGTETLPRGSVCLECNHNLSPLDIALTREHPAMMDAFQSNPNIKGYRRKGKNAEEKNRRKFCIEGKGEAEDTKIKRKGNDVFQINSNYYVTSEMFIRALHKCMANFLCFKFGAEQTRKSFPQLIDFVVNGGNVSSWSYAASYFNHFQLPLISNPIPFEFLLNGSEVRIIGFLHTSGIWITATHPNALSQPFIEAVSSLIEKKLLQDCGEKSVSCFGFNYDLKNRPLIGSLRFLWVNPKLE